jgi:hypothetical protein
MIKDRIQIVRNSRKCSKFCWSRSVRVIVTSYGGVSDVLIREKVSNMSDHLLIGYI